MVEIVRFCRSSLLAHCVSTVLATNSDFRLVGTAHKPSDLSQFTWPQQQAVLLVSVDDEFQGLLDIEELRSSLPNERLLALSFVGGERFGVYCLQAGATGFIGKDSMAFELFEAIHRVSRGLRYIPPAIVELMLKDVSGRDPNRRSEGLSAREFQVLSGIRLGKTVKEISSDLRISTKTVGTYRTRIMQKLQLETNADLILYSARADIRPGTAPRRPEISYGPTPYIATETTHVSASHRLDS